MPSLTLDASDQENLFIFLIFDVASADRIKVD